MNLAEALSAFAKPLLQTTDWYHWKIPDRKLPIGIFVKPGTSYQRNIDLKHALHAEWARADIDRRYELACFYVRDWGGIKGNSTEKLRRYAVATPDELISSGYDGVATWSKILCIHDPDRYAIFDARVCIALNFLQAVYNVQSPMFFQPLASQNRTIVNANGRMRSRALDQGWSPAANQNYYQTYLNVLAAAGAACAAPLYSIEMLLFAHAVELSARLE